MGKRQRALWLHHERGQAAVEFALTLLATLLLVFGIIEFSRAVFTSSVVQWAAQAGARAGIVSIANIGPAVYDKLLTLDPDKVTINITNPEAGVIAVEVIYPFDFITPLISQIAGDTVELSGSASMITQPFTVPSP